MEGSRQQVSLYEYLTNGPLYELIHFIALIWCTYAILTGILSYLLRLRSTCSARAQRFSCRQIFFSLFTDLDLALNPLNLSKLDSKLKIQENQAKLINLNNMILPLLDTQEDLVKRLHRAETRIAELIEEQESQTYTTLLKE